MEYEDIKQFCDYNMTDLAVLTLELDGYDTLLKSKRDTRFVGKEWFNFIGKYSHICDTTLRLINESELLLDLSFIFEGKYYTVAYMARYTENGIRGYDDDDNEIYGFVEGDEIY